MNIFKFEFKQLRTSILIWGLAVPASLFIYMAFFPIMADSADEFQIMMDLMPAEVLAMMGMIPELPVTTVLGYFSLTYTMIQIPLAIQAGNYGFNMLSVEERELTADFLISKPIKRSKIIISKFLATLLALTIVNAVIWLASISSILIFKSVDTIDLQPVYVLLSSVILFQLFFVSVGMLVSVLTKKIASVISYSMGLGFGMYILSSMGSLIGSDIFKLISPYSHFASSQILVDGHYDMTYASISIGIIIISLVGSYFLYLRRNIPSL